MNFELSVPEIDVFGVYQTKEQLLDYARRLNAKKKYAACDMLLAFLDEQQLPCVGETTEITDDGVRVVIVCTGVN